MSNVNDIKTGEPIDPASLKGGDGGGISGGMEARVRKLEDGLVRIEVKLDAISEEVRSLAGEVRSLTKETSEIKGKISQMPATWQLMLMMLTILGAAWAILRFGV